MPAAPVLTFLEVELVDLPHQNWSLPLPTMRMNLEARMNKDAGFLYWVCLQPGKTEPWEKVLLYTYSRLTC